MVAAQLCPTDLLIGRSSTVGCGCSRIPQLHRASRVARGIGEEIRSSPDARHQSMDEAIEARSLRPHCTLTWDEIHAEGQREDRQNLPLNFQEWDDSSMKPER